MRLICQVRAFRSTLMAPEGQLKAHREHEMHESMLITMCPLLPSGYWTGSAGYAFVTGFRNRFFSIVPANGMNPMMSPYRSVQLMHGSILKTRMPTSA